MDRWVVDGDVLGRSIGGGFEPSLIVDAWPSITASPGGLEIDEDDRLVGSRWVLTPRAVLGSRDGRAAVWIEASGGNLSGVVSHDPRVLDYGHLVRNGTVFPLEPLALDEVRAVLLDAGVAVGMPSFAEFIALRKVAAASDFFDDRLDVVSPQLFGREPGLDAVPAGVDATLFPYQLDGWRWLRFLAEHGVGGLLGDEMGLGKTLQVISLIADPGRAAFAPVLVIAPGTLLENWRRELAKFAPSVDVLIHQGPDRTGRPTELTRHGVVVTSYDTVMRDLGLLGTVRWAAVILDEAQAIRNPDAKRTAAVCGLHRDLSFAMTGTPMENRLMDIWSIMNFVAPGYLGTRREFDRRFGNDVNGALALEPLITPLMLRRRVRDVAKDLPPRIDVDVALVMPDDAARDYERLRLQAMQDFGSMGPLVAMLKLRQFCAHPQAVGLDWPKPATFPKTARLLEIMEEISDSGEKAIVFSSYVAVSDILVAALREKLNLWTDVIDGRVPLEDRQPIIDAFSAVEGPACLVLNPKVGGAGLNITAASHVIHYGLEWNPALEAQASARAWRRGQTRPVTIHRLFFADTVEEVMNDRLASKTELGDAAVLGVAGDTQDYEDALRALSLTPVRRSSQ